MEVRLKRVTAADTEMIWKMQVESFRELLAKYQDMDTNPANETAEKVRIRLEQPWTYYYVIQSEGKNIGAIRVVDHKENGVRKRISPLFILPEYRKQGFAQMAIEEVEKLHGNENWELETILQEKGNCYLYDKMGYRRTGKTEVINERLTLVGYQK